jgi:hypothetical protein
MRVFQTAGGSRSPAARSRDQCFFWAASLLPGREAASHVADGGQPHVEQSCRRKRRPPGGCAIKNEMLAGVENLLVIGALGVHPEFQHTASRMERARNGPLAFQLGSLADVDEDHARIAEFRLRFLHAQRADPRHCIRHQLLVAAFQCHISLLGCGQYGGARRVCNILAVGSHGIPRSFASAKPPAKRFQCERFTSEPRAVYFFAAAPACAWLLQQGSVRSLP